ncbi:unnamed protein product [Rotaria socialis]|uniref:G-protein coupled receptors family 1 profile domain-containing protein n=1 Tax=Rotaria socialis TaxID=392032 RepID=A0A821CZ14_9BILA|nr:unnamed protein product [Rotaria socialis]CAF3541650.1 unnamed protein product [Rotaria socialis]CAF4613461.1 unnamed protein product [Rotaria socialis]CAF4782166.1 unnamed protein product [Rotaria socialis]
MVLPVHTLIFANIVLPGNIGCVVSNNSVAIYHALYILIMGGTLPPLFMTLCTKFIWTSVKKKTQRRTMTIINRAERRKDSREHQVLILLLGQLTIFLISTIPFMSNNLYTTLTRDIPNKSVDRRSIEGFSQVSTELFVYMFSASSFYSNTLVSCKSRCDSIATFSCFTECYCRQRSRVSVTTQTRTNGTTNEISLSPGKQLQMLNTNYTSTLTRVQEP